MPKICQLCKTDYGQAGFTDEDKPCLCGRNSFFDVWHYGKMYGPEAQVDAVIIWVRFAISRTITTRALRISNWLLSPFWRPTWGPKETSAPVCPPYKEKE